MATLRPIQRVLIANRGEIAARIARAARAEGIVPLGIYSSADRSAPYLEAMERVAPVGGAAASESYLNVERILAAAQALGADAVHPGYGFLSERSTFAQAVASAGLLFIGPPPAALAAVGDKSEAKRHARACNVPVVPGYDGEDQTPAFLNAQATRIGPPLLIKASAGGGGRGIRVVANLADFDESLAAAKREAFGGFGDDRVLLERYLPRARHIEFQILADEHGTIVHLGERDCSVQRRHQKLLEEAPSPALTPELRSRMGEAAIRIARSVGYVNAGTVEFLLDDADAFFFLEMNARLQVEHAVTEAVYGVDLVRMQFRIACGQPVAMAQNEIVPRGWAIEARINAEDPSSGYLPASGTIDEWQAPSGAGLRIESGVRAGFEIPIDYDSLLLKVIASGNDRTQALQRLTRALEMLVVRGIPTNVPLLLAVLRDPAFVAGNATTALLEERGFLHEDPMEPDAVFFLALGAVLLDGIAWRIGSVGVPLTLRGPRRRVRIAATRVRDGLWCITGDLEATLRFESTEDGRIVVQNAQQRFEGRAAVDGRGVTVHFEGATFRCTFDRSRPSPTQVVAQEAGGRIAVAAPMPGRIARIAVTAGDVVRQRDLLVILEAMKMEHRIEAARPGCVLAVYVAPGLLVKSGAVLLELE
jgi:3-methylcrotonyl-CoA carboxylase alpha subunit